MKLKKIIAAVLSAATVLSLAGCGKEATSPIDALNSKPGGTSSAANSKSSAANSTPSAPESSAPESSVPESNSGTPEQNAQLEAVYDALDKVYQNEFHEMPFMIGDKLFYHDNRFVYGVGGEIGRSLYCYDLKTKENKILYTIEGEYLQLAGVIYKNGSFIFEREGSGRSSYIVKVDVEGTVSEHRRGIISDYGYIDVCDILENGGVLGGDVRASESLLVEMSPDLQTVVREIPRKAYVEVDVGHGLTDTQKVNLGQPVMIGDTYYAFESNTTGRYDEEVINNPANNLFYLNGEKWVRCDANTMPKEDYYYELWGLDANKVYNYKTGLVFEIGNSNLSTKKNEYLGSSYYGGNFHIVQDTNNNIVYKMQLDIDEGDIDFSKGTPLYELNTENNEHFFYLDDIYYLLVDKAGIFLRTYETGEAGEEMLVRF